MKLSECTMGRLVYFKLTDNSKRIGMVVGLTNNREYADCHERDLEECAVPLIKWANGAQTGSHHALLYPYTD